MDEKELVEKMARRWHGKFGWDNLTGTGKSQCYAQMNDLLSVVKSNIGVISRVCPMCSGEYDGMVGCGNCNGTGVIARNGGDDA